MSVALLVLTASASGCDEPPHRAVGLRTTHPGGLLATGAELYATVFSIARPDRVRAELSVCSGTLIAPTVLLTAAHCVTIERGDGRYEIQDPSEFFISNAETMDGLAKDLDAVDVDVHPAYAPGTALFDLAVVRLAQDATEYSGGRVMSLGEQVGEARVGMPRGIDIVAYGGNDYPATHHDPYDAPTQGVRLHLPHEINALGCTADDPVCDAEELAISFDNRPEAGFCGAAGGGAVLLFHDAAGAHAPVPWQHLQTSSPVPTGGSVQLVAVVSRLVPHGAAPCTGEGVATRVGPAIEFLSPWLPTPGLPIPEA